jgi:ANTAR domain-containing protein
MGYRWLVQIEAGPRGEARPGAPRPPGHTRAAGPPLRGTWLRHLRAPSELTGRCLTHRATPGPETIDQSRAHPRADSTSALLRSIWPHNSHENAGHSAERVYGRLSPRYRTAPSALDANGYRGGMPADNASMDGQLHDLYVQAAATRGKSQLLAGQLRATERRVKENWQLIGEPWDRTEMILADRHAARAHPDWLRFSAYARLRAQLTSLPVIEQAKGIIMAQQGWSEDEAFYALRRASQQEKIKVRDLAASIVARTTRSVLAGGHQAQHQPWRDRITQAACGRVREIPETVTRHPHSRGTHG